MQTGENGCGWVRMDAVGRRGHEGTQNKANRGHLGPSRPGFGPYGRGNFPGHHVLDDWVCMGVGGCIWVLMDTLGSRGTAGTKNNRKRSKNSHVMIILRCMSGRKKTGSWQGWLRWSDRIM